jgi:hypothetical protein
MRLRKRNEMEGRTFVVTFGGQANIMLVKSR